MTSVWWLVVSQYPFHTLSTTYRLVGLLDGAAEVEAAGFFLGAIVVVLCWSC